MMPVVCVGRPSRVSRPSATRGMAGRAESYIREASPPPPTPHPINAPSPDATAMMRILVTGFFQNPFTVCVSSGSRSQSATEGFLLGIPSLAVSLVANGSGYFITAARVAADITRRFADKPLRQAALFNVNVPAVEYAGLRGVEITRLGNRHKAAPCVTSTTPPGGAGDGGRPRGGRGCGGSARRRPGRRRGRSSWSRETGRRRPRGGQGRPAVSASGLLVAG